MPSSLVDSTLADGNAATDHGAVDATENKGEKKFFSVNQLRPEPEFCAVRLGARAQPVFETRPKVMNSDE